MMNIRTVVALLTFAALVADVSSFRSHVNQLAFVARGGSDEIPESVKDVIHEKVQIKEGEDVGEDDDKNKNEVESEGSDEQEEIVGVEDVCELRGGSDSVAETLDPAVDGEDYEYGEEEGEAEELDDEEELSEEELYEEEEMALSEAELADEEEVEYAADEDEEEIEDEYVMVEATEGIEEDFAGEEEEEADLDATDESEDVEEVDVDVEAAEESEDAGELPETEVAINENEALVDEEEDIEEADEQEDVEVELGEEYLVEDSVNEDDYESDAEAVEDTVGEETQQTWEENTYATTSYEGDVVFDDSSAFVDREELADAYDDDEIIVGATTFRAGHTDEDDRASIDDVPIADEATVSAQEFEQTEPEANNEAPVGEEQTIEEINEATTKAAAVPPAVITKEVEKILIQECGFLRSELRGLKPQIANVMADKRLRRPLEGIPASWYDATKKLPILATLGKILTAVIPAALGALAIYGGSDVRDLFSRIKNDDLQIDGEAHKSKSRNKTELTIPSNSTVSEKDGPEEEIAQAEPSPNSRHGVAKPTGGDSSWLDRQIDAVGNRVNSLLNK